MPQSYWQESALTRCMLIDIKAERINFKRAVLDRVQFSNVVDLPSANFAYATCLTCGFRGVNMEKLYAPHAIFKECDFGETQMNYAHANDAIFKRSLMTLAQCEGGSFHRVLFNEAQLRKVNFTAV